MKKIPVAINIAGLLFIVLSLASITSADDMGTKVGEAAPDFSLELLGSNENFNLADYRGKKAVWLVFWATWCPNCKGEIPKLDRIHEKYRKKIEILAINVAINDSIKKIERYRQKYPMPYKIAFNRQVTDLYQIQGTPTHVVIDVNGIIHYRDAIAPDDLKDSDVEELL
jgi:thiol-disulfide isomerase/thioredoxin